MTQLKKICNTPISALNIEVKFFIIIKNKKTANSVKKRFNDLLNGKVVTNINPLTTYVKAEEYHQKYILKKINETFS